MPNPLRRSGSGLKRGSRYGSSTWITVFVVKAWPTMPTCEGARIGGLLSATLVHSSPVSGSNRKMLARSQVSSSVHASAMRSSSTSRSVGTASIREMSSTIRICFSLTAADGPAGAEGEGGESVGSAAVAGRLFGCPEWVPATCSM